MEQKLDISRELHDNIGAQLTYISIGLDSVSNLPENEKNKKIADVKQYASTTIADLRTPVWGQTSDISATGLATKIGAEVAKIKKVYDIPIHFEFEVESLSLHAAIAINMFRIIQEAIHNACKHADASAIHVSLHYNEKILVAIVEDNGKGFDEAVVSNGFGLKSMQQRADKIGANLKISSKVEEGTTIYVETI